LLGWTDGYVGGHCQFGYRGNHRTQSAEHVGRMMENKYEYWMLIGLLVITAIAWWAYVAWIGYQ
jgi:hypothetical protein